MRLSQFLAKTLRDDPAEAETANHRLMLRTGMIQQIASGVYSYAPLAMRSLAKVEAIVRDEMNAAGGQEVKLPTLQPRELWQQTGRDAAFGPDLMRLKDRRERELVIAPTHEEAVTLLVKQHLQSYRDLPQLVYQIQTKFRDEPRPRGGLVRVREFDMKDAYSFDADAESLDETYQRMVQAYRNIFRRCGIPAVMIEADSGAIGGKDSHEFIMPTEIGEDTFIQCPGCGYAANAERAEFQRPPAPAGEPLPVEDVHTPGLKTIADLVDFLGITPEQTLKAVFYVVDGEMVFVTVRGDLEVNEIKLKRLLGATELHHASDEEVAAAGLVAGSASAVGLTGMKSVADESVYIGGNFAAGANRPGLAHEKRQHASGLRAGRRGRHRTRRGGPQVRPLRRRVHLGARRRGGGTSSSSAPSSARRSTPHFFRLKGRCCRPSWGATASALGGCSRPPSSTTATSAACGCP